MEAEGLLGTKLVLEGGVLEVFSRGASAIRLGPEGVGLIERVLQEDGRLRVTIRHPKGAKMLAFGPEQAPRAQELLAAFEGSSQ